MKVYVSTYHKYNNGTLKGAWLDLEDYGDFDEFSEACLELHEDEEDPELMFQDFEDIPSSYKDDLEGLYELLEAASTAWLDFDIFLAGAEVGIPADDIEEAYQGKYDSDEDFAQEFAESAGFLTSDQSWPYDCIDWERAARDLMYDYVENNGHYFRK